MTDSLKAKRIRAARLRKALRQEQEFEMALCQLLNRGVRHDEAAKQLGVTPNRIKLSSSRLVAEGRVTARYRNVPEAGAVDLSDDEAARADLQRWGIVYRDALAGGVDNPVRAFRNGAAVRPLVYGGSIAGACADAGQPVL
jgi:hypothetical protein